MNYSEHPNHVRVDFFKPSGKWYTTEKMVWTAPYYKTSIHDSFKQSLRDHFSSDGDKDRLKGMYAVCLSPYHEFSHLLMLCNRWEE